MIGRHNFDLLGSRALDHWYRDSVDVARRFAVVGIHSMGSAQARQQSLALPVPIHTTSRVSGAYQVQTNEIPRHV